MATIHEHFKDWCKITGRSGGVIIGASLRDFFDWYHGVITEVNEMVYISQKEYEAFKLSGSKDIKISFGSGIGVNVYYQDTSGNWVDITDYELW